MALAPPFAQPRFVRPVPSNTGQTTTENSMPRAHDYREAASLLRRLDARIAHDWALVRIASDPDRIAGGPTRSSIGRSLDTTDAELTRARVELERLARICDRRAEICAGFTADLLRHRQLVATNGVWSSPPAPPARWVEP